MPILTFENGHSVNLTNSIYSTIVLDKLIKNIQYKYNPTLKKYLKSKNIFHGITEFYTRVEDKKKLMTGERLVGLGKHIDLTVGDIEDADN